MITQLHTLYAETQDAHRLAWRHGYAGLRWEFVWVILDLETCIRDYEHGIYSYTTAHAVGAKARALVSMVAGMRWAEMAGRAS